VALLGKQGEITARLKSLGAMDAETRTAQAPKVHALREAVASAIADRKASLEAAELERKLATETIDLSLPAPESVSGTVHPVSQVMDELAEIFADLGFSVAEGPEIETQWYNFTALNMGESHPARAMMDTFYLEPREPGEEPRVLRTHTSPVQIRAGESRGAPIYVIAPGRVYRSDSDATHTPMFHQVEGFVIDKGITLGHLKWTLETFLKAFFEREDVVLRLRPSYFPFTEPSAEVDVGWSSENGRRVVGGQEGWMEVLGSGMVHPRVIANCGLDPDEWQGFAFGCGIDRLAMLKYGMDDLRAFFDGDIRWLKHYGFNALDVPTLSGGIGA
jgi:phenylalanyl-tRNA synthetase alpha chain